MKKMKQLILLTLCVFTLFGMTACAGKDKTDNAADDLTDENGAKKEGDRMKNTDQGDATGNADDSMR